MKVAVPWAVADHWVDHGHIAPINGTHTIDRVTRQGVYKAPDGATKDFIFQQTMMRIKASPNPSRWPSSPADRLVYGPLHMIALYLRCYSHEYECVKL